MSSTHRDAFNIYSQCCLRNAPQIRRTYTRTHTTVSYKPSEAFHIYTKRYLMHKPTTSYTHNGALCTPWCFLTFTHNVNLHPYNNDALWIQRRLSHFSITLPYTGVKTTPYTYKEGPFTHYTFYIKHSAAVYTQNNDAMYTHNDVLYTQGHL